MGIIENSAILSVYMPGRLTSQNACVGSGTATIGASAEKCPSSHLVGAPYRVSRAQAGIFQRIVISAGRLATDMRRQMWGL
jgi:hypothetical protein